MSDESDQRFAETIRAALDEDLERLDARTIARLRAARRAALARLGGRAYPDLARFLPAAAMASVAAAAVLFLWPNTESAPLLASNGDDSEIPIESRERIELYRDLDFYRWLAANERSS